MKKAKKHSKLLIIICILAIILIFAGLFGLYLSNPKKIIMASIDTLSNKVKEFVPSSSLSDFADSYTSTGSIKLSLKSDSFSSATNSEDAYVSYANILKNISNTENNYNYVVDKNSGKLFLQFTSKLNGASLFDAKYLIQNNTAYYFIAGFMNTYVNSGNNNLFQSLNNTTTTVSNMNYIYDVALQSFKKNLKNSYFTKSNTTITVNNKKENALKTTLNINNKNAKELAKAILKDLKNDAKAKEILLGIDKNFDEATVQDSAILEDNSLELTTYSNILTLQPILYEFKAIGSSPITIDYYPSSSKEVIDVLNGTTKLLTFTMTGNDAKKNIVVSDNNTKEIGNITINNEKDSLGIVVTIKDASYNINFNFTSKTTTVKANENYKNVINCAVKIVKDDVSLIDGSLVIDSNLSSATTINEDISNSVMASSISSADKDRLSALEQNILLKLMS